MLKYIYTRLIQESHVSNDEVGSGMNESFIEVHLDTRKLRLQPLYIPIRDLLYSI
jgi:hypothetical protein